MAHKGYRDESRKDYGTSKEKLTLEQINSGSLMRIADATELMASNYKKLQDDVQFYKKEMNYAWDRWNQSEKSNAAYRGHITRLRKEINNLKQLLNQ